MSNSITFRPTGEPSVRRVATERVDGYALEANGVAFVFPSFDVLRAWMDAAYDALEVERHRLRSQPAVPRLVGPDCSDLGGHGKASS